MEFELILEDENFEKLVIDTPTNVEVREQLGQPRTFTLTFADDICKGQYRLLQHPALDPLNSINIAVKRGGQKWYLIMGFIQSHSITVKKEGAGSQLQVTGSDNSARLSWVEEKWRWSETLSEKDIFFLLKRVAVRNAKEKVTSKKISQHSFDLYKINDKEFKKGDIAEEGGSPSLKGRNGILQSTDDLSFIQRIGKQSSRYFWVSYEDKDNKPLEIANFRKLPLEDFKKRKDTLLKLDVGGENSNIDQFTINWDINRPTAVKNKQYDPVSDGKKQEANINGATQPKLADNPVKLKDLSGGFLEGYISSPSPDAKNMKDKSEAALNEAEWFINANCSTSFERLCKYHEMNNMSENIKPIHAHTLVMINGAGKRYDGPYLVSGVTHTITSSSYEMQLQLQRNAWEQTE